MLKSMPVNSSASLNCHILLPLPIMLVCTMWLPPFDQISRKKQRTAFLIKYQDLENSSHSTPSLTGVILLHWTGHHSNLSSWGCTINIVMTHFETFFSILNSIPHSKAKSTQRGGQVLIQRRILGPLLLPPAKMICKSGIISLKLTYLHTVLILNSQRACMRPKISWYSTWFLYNLECKAIMQYL